MSTTYHLPNINNRSTKEYISGELYGGKPVWYKLVYIDILPNIGVKEIFHGVKNIDYIKIVPEKSWINTIDSMFPMAWNKLHEVFGATISVDEEKISVETLDDRSNFCAYICIGYRKTKDASSGEGGTGTPGEKGEPGKSFKISKVYTSIQEMNDDFNNSLIEVGDFVMIHTGSVEDDETGQLYVKTEVSFQFLSDLSGVQGVSGQSAYDIAVEHGFAGTEQEWLDYLSANGKSAYELAVEEGFIGTITEWLNSLKGSGKSAYDIAVEYGFSGSAQDWLDSLKGGGGSGSGENGKSAYEIAVENGFIGSVTEWLESLRGRPGNAGNAGPDGKDAYTLAKENGFIGSLDDWFDYLKGEDGQPGEDGSPFEIEKIYQSIVEMEADIDNIENRKFVLINNTQDEDDVDNGKIFIKNDTTFDYAFQFTGFQSIKGDKGDPGPVGPAPKLRKHNEYIQVSYDSGYIWTNLIALSDLTPILGSELLKVSTDEFNAIETRENGIFVKFPEISQSGDDPTTSVIKYYISNPSQTWSSDFTSSTYEGPEGSFIPARTTLLNAPIVKRLNLPNNFVSDTDNIIIQVSLDRITWFDVPITLSGKVIPAYNGEYGLGIESVTDRAINFVIGKGISSTVPWDFNFWYRVCIQRFVNVIVQYPTKSTLDRLNDSSFLSTESGVVVRENNSTKVVEGIVLPKIPEEIGSATPFLRSVNGKPQWSTEAPEVVYNNIGGITPTGAVLSAPAVNGAASYLKVDHKQNPKKVIAYCDWEKANGYPLCNNPNYKTWSYGLLDDSAGYMYPIATSDYLGYFFYEDVTVNQVRIRFFDNFGNDPYAIPRSFEVFLTHDGVNWFSDTVKTFTENEYNVIIDLSKTYDEIRGFRVLFTNFNTARYTTSYVDTIDIGVSIANSFSSSIRRAPFEVYPSDNFTKAPLILSFNDGYDDGGIRNIVKKYNGTLECEISEDATQYIYASYDKFADETTLLAQTSLILERDTGDRWYDAGNITTTGNTIYSPGYYSTYYATNVFDKNNGTSWISASTAGNDNGDQACIGSYIGQRNIIGQLRHITVVNRDANYNPYNIIIEYSFDEVTWHLLRYFSFTNFGGGGANEIPIADYAVGMTPHHIRLRALDSGPNNRSWRINEIYMYANRKYDDSQIIFNTRTQEYRNGFGDYYNLLYLGRITRNNNLETNVGIVGNYIVDSSAENNATTLATYNTSARWRTASKNTNSYFGQSNLTRPIRRIQWYTFTDATYNATSVAVEIQRDNNPAGTWETVGTYNVANTASTTITLTPNYDCDTVHCIRVRLTANKDWIIFWAKFFEQTPVDGNEPYHYHYQLHDQQSLGLKFETAWFAVGANGTYTFSNKLASSDVEVELYWSPSPSYDGMMSVHYWRTEYGASVRVDRNNVTIRVGTDRTFYSNYTNSSGGYYKLILKRRY